MPGPSVFISYSHKDEEWKNRLRPHLGMLEKAGRLTIWDDRSIDGGATWYPEIKQAMENAAVAVCLISADYLNSDFCLKEEIPYLLQRRESEGMLLLPVLIHSCLWDILDWLKAIQMLPRDGKTVAEDFKDSWNTPFAEVARRVNSFLEAPTREAIAPPRTPRWSPPEKVDVDRLPVTGAELFGRKDELKILDEAWETRKINVISFVAWGGVGKSTLVNKWREGLAADNYRGAKRVFAWSFYSQGTGERVTSADIFIAEALKWFGDPDMANSNASPWDKGGRLAELVGSEKTLLLLDGMEPLQSSLDFERGKIKDPALAVLVTELAKENPGLCVITTRESVYDLADFSETAREIDLEQISAEAGRALLRVGGVQGTDAELEGAARDFGLHALALNLLAAYIHEIPGHHVSNAAEIPDIDVPLKEGKHPRRVMSAFAKRFGEDSAEVETLRILGLFSSPAEKAEIAAVRAALPIPDLTEHVQNLSESEWLELVTKLRDLKLLAPKSSHRPDSLDAHPLVREHFGAQLKGEYPAAWHEGNNRLYEYYKASAREYPDTLQEMAPLFAAVMHGCQAGRHQEALEEVYWKRIQRRNKQFVNKKLGAFGSELATLSGLFDPPWRKPVDGLREKYKGFILGYAGYDLRALGRLAEAAQPMQASLDSAIEQKDWKNAAIRASNLSELTLTIGHVKQALAHAEQSVQLADKSDDEMWRMVTRTKVGDVQHQAGHFEEAQSAFSEAEAIQEEQRLWSSTKLVSVWGFNFCDLLLSKKQWQEVQDRANRSLKICEEVGGDILSEALDNLSLGRAHLLHAQQTSEVPPSEVSQALTYLNRAVDGLRQAGQQFMLPLGLLARAAYYRVTGNLDKAKKDLDEAFTIASRGGMGLYLADCHLEYARLSKAKNEKQKAREHLKIAKEMIEKMGYHRRDKEVEEIEMSLRGAERRGNLK